MSDQFTYGAFFPFGGSGGGALGFLSALQEWNGLRGRFVVLGGADSDPEACQDFEALTGVPEAHLDLFSHADYIAFHGTEPPADWREATPADVWRASQNMRPDVVFTSPPCKGFSGLLPTKSAESPKYKALDNLTLRGIALVLEAWREDPPGLIILENVPRITSRGAHLLAKIKALLIAHGYRLDDTTHDLGEVGGLSQHRKRYLLVARRPTRIPAFLYHPPRRKVRAIGDTLAPLPMPDDPACGPMHRLPRLSWLTWVRLALIPAGRDWRALQGIEPGSYAIQPAGCAHFNHVMKVTAWDEAAGAVAGGGGPGSGAINAADPRIAEAADQFNHTYRVVRWQDPAGTVTAANSPANGAGCVADPRLGHDPRKGVFSVAKWDEPTGTVVGSARVAGSNGTAAVADPRVGSDSGRHASHMRVTAWDEAAGTVTGATHVGNGLASVADPRVPERDTRRAGDLSVRGWDDPANTVTGEDSVGSGAQSIADPRVSLDRGKTFNGSPGLMGVQDWNKPASTVTAGMRPASSNTPASVADPRLTCSPHNGAYRVVGWEDAAPTVTGAGDVHSQGAAAVADPRPPKDRENGTWVIIAEDNTWHRPLTTLELAALQGLPMVMRNGQPLTLAGKSQSRWRERIGNAVPVPSARAIAEQMLLSLMATSDRQWLWSLYGTAIWVRQQTLQRVLVVRRG